MAYYEIAFSNTGDPSLSRIGGLPLLTDKDAWPRYPETGKPLLHLATFRDDFFSDFSKEISFPDDHCLSVFILFDDSTSLARVKACRALAVHGESDIAKLQKGASRVLLYEVGSSPCEAPANAPEPIPMMKMELRYHPEEDANPYMSDRGSLGSKLGGRPGWGQDPIDIPGYRYVLQMAESPIRNISPKKHSAIFQGGIGFLFLREEINSEDPGLFFIQFT